MSTSILAAEVPPAPRTAAWWFGGCALAVIVAACLLAGFTPIAFSIATVFLFAGPHNWLEARYFMTRMPPRWGRLRTYFLIGLGGVPLLTAAMIILPYASDATGGSRENWLIALALWNSALVLWIVTLATMRSSQNPRRSWPWLWPAALALIAAAWMWPYGWILGLVYLHPLMALVFLDIEIGRRKPELRSTYRACLALVPVAIALLAWRLAAAPDLPGDDVLTSQITHHAGAGILSQVSTHFLVSTHTFLEMLHYGVWCLALPLVALSAAPWQIDSIPLARKSSAWKVTLAAALVTGLAIVALLWIGFMIDYPLTRSVYFTIAMLHVLAEFPFLLRLV
jgi:hypothetical protein